MGEYPIIIHHSFDWMIAAYLFLAGIAVGSFLLSVVAAFWKKDLKPLATIAGLAAPVALAAGLLVLLVDLGQPLRAWRLFLHLNPRSFLSWGVWFLNIFFVITCAYNWFLLRGDEVRAKKLAHPGIFFAILVAIYPGLFFAQAPAKVLWHSALLPPLFLVGGVISGLAFVILAAAGKIESKLIDGLGKFVASLLIVEAGLLFCEFTVLLNGGYDGVITAKAILLGSYSLLFWGGEILIGSLIPIVILFKARGSALGSRIASLLILLGIYLMRYIVVTGGQVTG